MENKLATFIDSKLFWYLSLSEWESLSITSGCFIVNHNFYINNFECITCSSSLSMEEIKLFAIVTWTFHVSGFLKLFMMSFRYDLILLKYSSREISLFVSSLLLYSLHLLLQKLLTLTALY